MRGEDRLLLDLLCLAAPQSGELDRVFRLRKGWGEVVDRLRMRGLVAFDSLRPSPSALAAFAKRHAPPAEAPPAPLVEEAPLKPPLPERKMRVWDTPERQETFAAALGRTGTVRAALAEIGLGINTRAAYSLARQANPAFAARCDAALATFRADKVASRAAKPKLPKAEPVVSIPAAPAPAAAEAPRGSPAPAPSPQPRESYEAPARRSGSRSGAFSAFSFRKDPPVIPRTRKSDAEISAEALRLAEERKKYQPPGQGLMSLDDAKLLLQQRGRVVFRSSVAGGRADLWTVSGMGREVTDEQLVAAAQRVRA
jgi:hypothetical protein